MKKIGNAFGGIFGGFVFLVIGVILLWWNEGNNVRNIKSTAEMEKLYVDVSSESVDASNEGKLVATYGKILNEEELTDDTFKVTVKTPLLKRVVEMYQWKEESETDEEGFTRYRYDKEWSQELIDSDNFNESGHVNPKSKKYDDETKTSSNVKVGAFELSSNQINSLSTDGKYTDYNETIVGDLNLTILDGYATTSKDLSKPEIGDIRISFVYNNSTDVSVLAVQSGQTFVDFVSKEGRSINRVMDGVHSGIEMINIIRNEDNFLKWILRAVGIIILAVGFGAILKPISAITSYVPLLGNLVGSVVGLVSFILGICLGLVVIAIAWIRFRPILGISLLAIVAVLFVLLLIRGKKSKQVETVAQ